jgi:hypothetical protein
MDLSHWGHQHIDATGRLYRGYSPMPAVPKEAIETLGSVALSSPMAAALVATLLVS